MVTRIFSPAIKVP